jgi:MFS family permease
MDDIGAKNAPEMNAHGETKAAYVDEKQSPPAYEHDAERNASITGPSWMYKRWNFLGASTWYASPATQIVLVAFVCFLCPGMFNAISGIGAAGQLDRTASNDSNTALYTTFAVVGFFAGTIVNRIGIKLTLSIGGTGYCIYVASFLCYNHTQNRGFVIFAGAFLGACAGCLWAAQGAIMMSYPGEKDKGKYIAYFWMIFNMGGVLGSLVRRSVGNWHVESC